MDKKLHMVSLGCAKNLVNAEQMLAALLGAGYEYCEDPEEADVIVVNTCAFIEDAKQEAIENILELAELKNTGALVGLVVTGCLSQRYGEELLTEMPEIDAILGTGSYEDIVEVCDKLLLDAEAGNLQKIVRMGDIDAPLCEAPRLQTTPEYTAYLKIAEGCDNHCAYCIIPSIRGRFRSREMDAIVTEAENLVANGVKELVVVAQDLTAYGLDLYGKRSLAPLLERLCQIEDLRWLRLHYLYPDEIDDELIEVIAREPKILKYLDIPIQHVSDRLLRSMNRRYTRAELEALIKKLRKAMPKLVLRTSVIVGLPGETDDDFAELCSFIQRTKLQRAGVFKYSQEEGTLAAEMPDQVDEDVKIRRQDVLVEIENRVIDQYNAKMIGKKVEVLVEGYDRTAGCFYSRSYAESPDIDGKVFFTSPEVRPQPGEFVTVKITEDMDGDLIGELVAE
ncbi:MAG: 30S ribosomal protein S12 methylthiotransferase RimO [Ruminococcaceae bacterium]|nr:30S ribosomal protein S12 methylthiotransferase RimO [Oscillospiraceae bacterium]